MSIYYHSDCQPNPPGNLNLIKLDNNHGSEVKICFYYNHYHEWINKVPFSKFLNDDCWKKLQTDSNSFVLHENTHEVDIYEKIVLSVKYYIEKFKILPNQFYFVVGDEALKNLLVNKLQINGIIGVNVDYTNTFFKLTKIPKLNLDEVPTKKFSVFSRNYKIDRLLLFFDLIKFNLIDEFHYTFNNSNPYSGEIFEKDILKTKINDEYRDCENNIKRWIEGCPYTIKNADIENLDLYYNVIKSSIHLVIETHFTDDIQFFCSEKTFKPVVCKKPFLIYGRPHHLKYMRSMGFKTFDGYLNEEYDLINDNLLRKNTLIKELVRLNSLTDHELLSLIKKCNEIVEFNYNVFLDQRKKTFNQNFSDLNIFKSTHIGNLLF